MKLRNTLLALVLAVVALLPQYASAHFPQIDGSIVTILHVDPDDDPAVAGPSTLYFDVAETNGDFDGATCNCTVKVFTDTGQILEHAVTPEPSTSIYTYKVPIVFPNAALYHITLAGTPKKAGAFQPFSLTWDFRVGAAPPQEEKPFSPMAWVAIVVLLAALIAGIWFIFRS